MKTRLSLLAAFLLTISLSAQTFRRYPPSLPMDGLVSGGLGFADVDNDGDEDVLLTGSNGAGAYTRLFLNEGPERFKEATGAPFTQVFGSSFDFADVDGDGDKDVLIAGSVSSEDYFSTLYLNDGAGNFTATFNQPFVNATGGAVKFADVDGDQDPDVLITGYERKPNGNMAVAKLYLNNGHGSFAELANSTLEGAVNSSAAFADVDGDQDLDVLINGNTFSSDLSAKLYLNDGAGYFTKKANTPFVGGISGTVSFADIDGDQDQDVLITGQTLNSVGFVKLYLNGGQGNYTEVLPAPFTAFNYTAVAWADPDADGDQDVLILGQPLTGTPTGSKLYINDGTGHFAEALNAPFPTFTFGEVAYSDIDGDADLDVLMTGYEYDYTLRIRLFENDGTGNYKEILAPFYEGLFNSSSAFVDIDGDKALDLIYSGLASPSTPTFKLYRNDADGTADFTQLTTDPVTPGGNGDFAWADIDGDFDQDLLLTGGTGGLNRIIKLYVNNGNGELTEVPDTPLMGTIDGDVNFADIDGDQDQDVLITGKDRFAQNIAHLFTNDGAGHFSQDLSVPFSGVTGSSAAFADVDGDLDQDVLITGKITNDLKSAKLYINNGSGSFTAQLDANFTGVYNGDVTFADVDGDLDQDVLITGISEDIDTCISKIYLNDGAGHFSLDADESIERLGASAAAFADLDGDQDQDLIITGSTADAAEKPITKWYTNDGAGHFTEVTNHPFRAVKQGSVSTADVDGDQDIDVFITGLADISLPIATLYLNESGNVAVEPEKAVPTDNFLLYPNPTSGSVTLEITSESGKSAHISLCDLNGKTLRQQAFDLNPGLNKLSLEYSGLPTGFYLLSVKEEGRLRYLKLLIN